MEISIVKGAGAGLTKKSAFDDALKQAGVSDYNLIYLSSIVPPGSIIESEKKYFFSPSEYGNRLYVVMAEAYAQGENNCATAGIGWSQEKDGRGVFVEHTGISEPQVKDMIECSLSEMCRRRADKQFISSNMALSSVQSSNNFSACAVVIAVIKCEGWYI